MTNFDKQKDYWKQYNLKMETYDYKKIKSLSAEALEKLSAIRPKSIGQASRISGVSPSDVSILMVHMKK